VLFSRRRHRLSCVHDSAESLACCLVQILGTTIRFFRDLTEQWLRRGIFRDVEEMVVAFGDYIGKHNDNPKPFVWIAKASDVLKRAKRARAVLDNP
jgi:hypothetical protein